MIGPVRLINNMNHVHKDITFKPTFENNELINFLGLLLIRIEVSIEVDIYWNLPLQIKPLIFQIIY